MCPSDDRFPVAPVQSPAALAVKVLDPTSCFTVIRGPGLLLVRWYPDQVPLMKHRNPCKTALRGIELLETRSVVGLEDGDTLPSLQFRFHRL